MFSDQEILRAMKQGKLVIDPFDEDNLQPASYDVHLGSVFRTFRTGIVIDPMREQPEITERLEIKSDEFLLLKPGEFILGAVTERIALNSFLSARLEGKSSLARLGLLIHTTSGFVDPGFVGFLTIELSNVNHVPMCLYPGMPIGQLCFMQLDSRAIRAYGVGPLGSKYQDQGPEPQVSRYYKNFKSDKES